MHSTHLPRIVPLLFAMATSAQAAAPQAGPGNPLVQQGRRIFRHDTFGDEAFWGGTLRLHDAIQGAAFGGVGPGVSPATALSVGLKVDIAALDEATRGALGAGSINLNDPAVTLALLAQDAVVGVEGFSAPDGSLASVGITCALCHSTVDDRFAPGLGRRLDGWANRDLNVGAIISLAPDLSFFANALNVTEPTVRAVLGSWGPGKFDAHLLLDGQAFRPDGESGAVLIPAAHGLAGLDYATYNGWGSVSHWNALVSNLEMGGQGTFLDERLNDASRFPVAAALGLGNVRNTPDQTSGKLAALGAFQMSLVPPHPPRGSFDESAALRGRGLFNGKAQCATCHVPPLFSEPGWNLHDPADIGIDSFQADRGPEGKYRTTPLRGLHARLKGGLYHDGRFPTLDDVVEHYDVALGLALSADEQADIVQYLLSL